MEETSSATASQSAASTAAAAASKQYRDAEQLVQALRDAEHLDDGRPDKSRVGWHPWENRQSLFRPWISKKGRRQPSKGQAFQ